MAIIHMVVKKLRNLFLQTALIVGLVLSLPVFVLAGSNYGDCAYGSLTYGGDCTPAAAAASGGGGLIVGSGPNAPGYVNTNPYGTTTVTATPTTTPSTTPITPTTSGGSTSATAAFTRDLDINVEGVDVQQLQQWLNAHGYQVAATGSGSPGNETAHFGPATQQALAKYQTTNGITPATGYFGPKTRAAIGDIVTTPTTPAPVQTTIASSSPSNIFTRDLQLGDTGTDVTALQQYLNTHGYILANSGVGSAGNETDYFGNATKYQLSQLQAANGISPAAGYFGPKTRALVSSN